MFSNSFDASMLSPTVVGPSAESCAKINLARSYAMRGHQGELLYVVYCFLFRGTNSNDTPEWGEDMQYISIPHSHSPSLLCDSQSPELTTHKPPLLLSCSPALLLSICKYSFQSKTKTAQNELFNEPEGSQREIENYKQAGQFQLFFNTITKFHLITASFKRCVTKNLMIAILLHLLPSSFHNHILRGKQFRGSLCASSTSWVFGSAVCQADSDPCEPVHKEDSVYTRM